MGHWFLFKYHDFLALVESIKSQDLIVGKFKNFFTSVGKKKKKENNNNSRDVSSINILNS